MNYSKSTQLAILIATAVAVTWPPRLHADPPEKFIYGVWGNAYFSAVDSVPPLPPGMAAFASVSSGGFTGRMDTLQDTLGFNVAFGDVWNAATAESLIQRGFKVVEFDRSYEPGKPSDFAHAWYLLWQTDQASIPSWYQGSYQAFQGAQTLDGGDTVWAVGGAYGGSRGWMLRTGGSNYRFKDATVFPIVRHQLEFRLKATGINPSDTVAAIYSVMGWYEEGVEGLILDTVATDTLFGSDFTPGVYQLKLLNWDQPHPNAAWNTLWAYYSVFWFGRGTLYFDEVLSSDVTGRRVIAGEFDDEIDNYTTTFTYGTDGSYLLGWYLLDETSRPENNACWEHVNQRLQLGTGHKGGFQQWNNFYDVYSAIKMTTPTYLMCIDYLANGSHCDDGVIDDSGAVSSSTDSPGGDSVSLQVAFNTATSRFRQYKHWADDAGLPFWPMLGGFIWYNRCGAICFEKLRRPTGYELRAHAGLALAYGGDALSFFRWGAEYCYIDGIYPGSPSYAHIRDLVSPFIVSLGDLFYDLYWLGADSSQVASTAGGSFIDSVRSLTYPSRPFVEVAFFKDTATQADYFMLVNRRCLPTETQQVRSWLDRAAGMYYVIDMYSHDTALTGSLPNGAIPFMTTLEPSEGKLFKIVPVGTAYVSGSALPKTWQGGIRVGGNVDYDSTRSLTILGPANVVVDSSYWGYTLTSYGDVTLQGYPGDTVRLRSTMPTDRDQWAGIKLLGAADLTMEYAQVKNAYKGVWVANGTYGPTRTINVSINHCDFRTCEMAGVWLDTDTSSAVTIKNSHFTDLHYYGLNIYKGRATVDSNEFTGAFLNGIRLEANSTKPTGGQIRWNKILNMSTANASAINLQSISNDMLDSSVALLRDNEISNYLGGAIPPNAQVGIYMNNCTDHIRILRNAVGGGVQLQYGILNFSTRTLIDGDTTQVYTRSRIQVATYGLYCFSTSASDSDYAKVRQCWFQCNGYNVYVHSLSKVDLGTDSSKFSFPGNDNWGNNVFQGTCDLCSAIDVDNNNALVPVFARRNCWYYCTNPYNEGDVRILPKRSSSPFRIPTLEKLVTEQVINPEPDGRDVASASSYPNPFNSAIVIQLELRETGNVVVAIYNILGQQVRKLVDEQLEAGSHSVAWDGRDNNGRSVSSGVYFYRVSTPTGWQTSKKIVLLK